MSRTIGLLSALCLAGCMALHQEAPARVDSMPRLLREGKVMDLAELSDLLAKAKMEGKPLTGYGLTVFEGTKIERFDVEIVDIMRNYIYPKHDLILFRAHHKRWLDGGNVVSGMSGSPCYVNDKMIGALSFSLGIFQREPLGGITPIEYMVREMDRPIEQARAGSPRFDGSGREVAPVRTPLFLSGFSPRTMDAFEKRFEERGFVMARSAGGSSVVQADDRFEPGSAIGGALMLGDYSMTGIGTVTMVDGDRVLAFGHPFFQAGELEMPLTTAVIHTTFQGTAVAYKIGSADKVIGALVNDRANAIVGRVGKTARMVPVTITARNAKLKTEQTVRLQCIDHPVYFPLLVMIAHAETLNTFEPSDNPHVTSSAVSVTMKGGRRLQYADIEQYEPGFFSFGGGPIGKIMELAGNEFEKPAIESVEIVSDILNEERGATVKAAWPLAAEVEDGGTVRIRCLLKRYRGPEVAKEIELKLPKGLKKGSTVTIQVGGGSQIAEERPPASTLDELIATLQKGYKSTSLVAAAALPSYDLMYRGRVLDQMPNSMLAQMVPSLHEAVYLAGASQRVAVDTDWVITGTATVTIRIK